MKFLNIYAMMAILLSSLQTIAQKNNVQVDLPQFKRLQIGDQVPLESIALNHIRNYPSVKTKLSDFKGKYIILDFWTKQCAGCIASFPRMEKLQEQFKTDVQILLVTKNSNEELASLFAKSPIVKETKLPMVTGDSILSKVLFPHGSVPFHVWLDRSGKVVATTYSSETNSENITSLIAGRPLNLLVKNEILDRDVIKDSQNEHTSLLRIGNGLFLSNLKYYAQIPALKLKDNSAPKKSIIDTAYGELPILHHYSLIMSFMQGDILWSNSVLKDKGNNSKGFRIINQSVATLYRKAFLEKDVLVAKVIAEGKAKLLYEELTDTTNGKRHLIHNNYCYESSLPDYSYENAKKILQRDLVRFFGMEAFIEEKPMKCILLTRLGTTNEKKLWAKKQIPLRETEYGLRKRFNGGVLLRNFCLGGILQEFMANNKMTEDPVILDATGFTEKEFQEKTIDVFLKCSLKCSPDNIPKIQKELSNYGLGLKEEIRNMKVLVLKMAL